LISPRISSARSERLANRTSTSSISSVGWRDSGSGLDLWEVIATVRDNDESVEEAAAYLEIPLGLVQAAVA